MRVLVTSRPQTLVALDVWKPIWIQPSEAHNLRDMEVLVRARLANGEHVLGRDMDAATQLVVRKSQVGLRACTTDGIVPCVLCSCVVTVKARRSSPLRTPPPTPLLSEHTHAHVDASTPQGQLIYTKYLFDDLRANKGPWSLADLEASLPHGLAGFFSRTMQDIEAAVYADGRGELW